MASWLVDPGPDLAVWLAALAVHGTLLLGLAWLCTRPALRMPPVWAGAIWKLAVVAPFLTSALQLLWGAPLFGAAVPAAEPAAPPVVGLAVAEPLAVPSPDLLPAAAPSPAVAPSTWIALVVLALALVGLVRWLVERIRLARRLRNRHPVSDPVLRHTLAALCRRAGVHRSVRLTTSSEVASPIAFGVLRPEITLPVGLCARLGLARSEALLAHELAHIEGRDPGWLALLALLVRLCWWQPLLRLARRSLRELAEFRCDARAAELTARDTMARCLVDVADWIGAGRPVVTPELAGMTVHVSQLGRRVDRLLSVAGSARAPRRTVVAVAALLVLAGATAALPGPVRAPRPALPPVESYASLLVEQLASLDADCADLAGAFTTMQRSLAQQSIDAVTLSLLMEIAQRLDGIEKRRSDLRHRVLAVLADAPEPATHESDPTGIR